MSNRLEFGAVAVEIIPLHAVSKFPDFLDGCFYSLMVSRLMIRSMTHFCGFSACAPLIDMVREDGGPEV